MHTKIYAKLRKCTEAEEVLKLEKEGVAKVKSTSSVDTHGSQTSGEVYEIAKDDPYAIIVKEKKYKFQKVELSSSSCEDVYVDVLKPLVESFLKGVNVCLFVIGERGSGKSQLIGGAAPSHGLAQLLFEDIFHMFQDESEWPTKPKLTLEMYEYETERFRNLMSSHDEDYVEVVETATDGPTLANCERCLEVTSVEDLTKAFDDGWKHRKCDPLATTSVMVQLRMSSSEKEVRSRLSVVELGCEYHKYLERPDRKVPPELSHLQTLTQVVQALAQVQHGDRLIDYSGSVYTQYLREELGGNCETRGLACLHPVFNGRLFATCIKLVYHLSRIDTFPIVNNNHGQNLVTQFRAELLALKRRADKSESENEKMKADMNRMTRETTMKNLLHLIGALVPVGTCKRCGEGANRREHHINLVDPGHTLRVSTTADISHFTLSVTDAAANVSETEPSAKPWGFLPTSTGSGGVDGEVLFGLAEALDIDQVVGGGGAAGKKMGPVRVTSTGEVSRREGVDMESGMNRITIHLNPQTTSQLKAGKDVLHENLRAVLGHYAERSKDVIYLNGEAVKVGKEQDVTSEMMSVKDDEVMKEDEVKKEDVVRKIDVVRKEDEVKEEDEVKKEDEVENEDVVRKIDVVKYVTDQYDHLMRENNLLHLKFDDLHQTYCNKLLAYLHDFQKDTKIDNLESILEDVKSAHINRVSEVTDAAKFYRSYSHHVVTLYETLLKSFRNLMGKCDTHKNLCTSSEKDKADLEIDSSFVQLSYKMNQNEEDRFIQTLSRAE